MQSADTARHAERARATWRAMRRRLYAAPSGLYHEPSTAWLLGSWFPRRGEVAALWPFANAWAATRAVATLDGAPGTDGAAAGAQSWRNPASPVGASWNEVLGAHVDALGAYARRPSALAADDPTPLRLEATTKHPPAGGDAYYDDNGWVALALFAQHALTGDAACLRLARRSVAFVLSGWTEDPAYARPGGIRWAEPAWSTTRNTCSNGPAAEAAALGELRAGDAGGLDWAQRIVGWVDSTLRSEHGLYFDRIERDGSTQRELWVYNQGTMLGAKVLLFEATGEAAHLEGATAIASAVAAWLEPWGVLVEQPPPLLAIYVRNLLLLAPHADVSPGLAQAARFADWAWEHERHRSGLFRSGELKLNRTAGMTALYALLAGATPAP